MMYVQERAFGAFEAERAKGTFLQSLIRVIHNNPCKISIQISHQKETVKYTISSSRFHFPEGRHTRHFQ